MAREPWYRALAWRVFEFLFWAFIVLQAVGSFHDWILGIDDGRPHSALNPVGGLARCVVKIIAWAEKGPV